MFDSDDDSVTSSLEKMDISDGSDGDNGAKGEHDDDTSKRKRTLSSALSPPKVRIHS